jgi:type II secretion system protein N
MATETKIARWKLVLGYGAFAVAAFFLCLMLTFPYDSLRRIAVEAAADAGYALHIGSLRPGLRGLTATNVRLHKTPHGISSELRTLLTSPRGVPAGAEELGEPLHVDSVAVRPSLFPLGLAFHVDALKGSIRGSVGGIKDVRVAVKLNGLDASGGNLPAFSGVDLEGTLGGSLNLTLPQNRGQPDLAQASGELALDSQGLIIKGGTVTVPMYGQPTPVDLPRIALGELTARLKLDKGQGTVEALESKSEDLEIQGSGTLRLAQRLDLSQPDMDIKLRAEPAFVSRLGILGAGLSVLPTDKADPKFRVAHLSGFLNRPNFGPARRQQQQQ